MIAMNQPPRRPKGKDYLGNDRLLQNLHNYFTGLRNIKWKHGNELEHYIY